MIEKESFVFYKSFHTALRELPDEIRLKLYDMISTYALFGEELECSGVEKAVFSLIKPQVDANNQRYENGCRGGAPKGNKNAQKKEVVSTKNNRATTKKQPKNNQKQPNENENENDNIPPFYSPLNGDEKEKKPFEDDFFAKYPRYAKDRKKMREDVDYKRLIEEFEKRSEEHTSELQSHC